MIPPPVQGGISSICLREVGNFQAETETLPRSDLRQGIRKRRAKRRLTAVGGVGSGWRVRTGREKESVATPEASGECATCRIRWRLNGRTDGRAVRIAADESAFVAFAQRCSRVLLRAAAGSKG
jgi:hypothetical protein